MLRFFRKVNRKAKKIASTGPRQVPLPHDFKEVSSSLADNEAYLRQEFADISDIVFRQFYAGGVKILAVWFDGLINNKVNEDVFRALMLGMPDKQLLEVAKGKRTDFINKRSLPFYDTQQVTDLEEIKRWILMSKMVLLVDGCPSGLMVDAENRPQRYIAEPVVEPTVLGPHEGFVENL
ncbi:MAG: spore germination protein, partial [Desulfotomaculaceae bacterium]|nr:spore germination protein [Desulfotomaculaceae bacterium]